MNDVIGRVISFEKSSFPDDRTLLSKPTTHGQCSAARTAGLIARFAESTQ
jgi:hypothetical protein